MILKLLHVLYIHQNTYLECGKSQTTWHRLPLHIFPLIWGNDKYSALRLKIHEKKFPLAEQNRYASTCISSQDILLIEQSFSSLNNEDPCVRVLQFCQLFNILGYQPFFNILAFQFFELLVSSLYPCQQLKESKQMTFHTVQAKLSTRLSYQKVSNYNSSI